MTRFDKFALGLLVACLAGAVAALALQKWAAACCFTLAVGLCTVYLNGVRR